MTTDHQPAHTNTGRTTKGRAKLRPEIPQALCEVALVDAITSAAIGGMGVSWWLAEVAAGRAPQPAIRAPRCTRWTMASIKTYWSERANGFQDSGKTMAQSRKASAAAHAKRRSQQAQSGEVKI